jgi:RHS repeat-associated protein
LSPYDISNIGYDLNGNILSINKGGTNYTYNYYSGTNKIQNTDGSGNDYVYDANGNITTSIPKGLNPISYDPFTQMTKSITITGTPTHTINFQYTADNERILKNEKQGTTNNNSVYVRGNSDYPITEKINTNNALADKIYIYGPTGLIAFKDATATYFVMKDHLGSTRVLFRSTGSQYSTYDYSPFGTLMRSSINGDVRYRFTGQEYDSETALYNFRARLYDDELGIFYAVDPAGQDFSPFSYAGNNPIIFVDKDGRFWEIFAIVAAAWLSGSAANDWQFNPLKWDWQNPSTYFWTIGGGLGGWATYGALASGTLNLGFSAKWLSNFGTEIASVGATLSEVGTSAMYLSSASLGLYGAYLSYYHIRNNWDEFENAAEEWWNSPVTRSQIPDFTAIGLGFSGIAGFGGVTSFELRWVLRGPEASLLPMVTTTQSIGMGWNYGATVNIEGINYYGPVDEIRREMMQTITPVAGGSFPTIWGSFGMQPIGNLGLTIHNTYWEKTGRYLWGGELNVGFGFSPVGFYGSGGVSNTFILYDWYR